jgi:hypothetical protein
MKIKKNLFIPFLILSLIFTTIVQSNVEDSTGDSQSSHSSQSDYNSQEETPICGGFLEFDLSISQEIKRSIDYSSIIVQTFTMDMILKEQTNLAASGYYFLPIYENESFIMKISGPYGMNFEPEQYVFTVDGEKTVASLCKGDVNFKFRGFVVEGQVSTFGTNEGPEGVNLVLYDENEAKVQTTRTVEKGLFKFKPVNPGVYILRPHEDVDMFDKEHNMLKFRVNVDSTNFLERALIIRGF